MPTLPPKSQDTTAGSKSATPNRTFIPVSDSRQELLMFSIISNGTGQLFLTTVRAKSLQTRIFRLIYAKKALNRALTPIQKNLPNGSELPPMTQDINFMTLKASVICTSLTVKFSPTLSEMNSKTLSI